ncbi:hypothetical protein HELRODRAFT_182010 [Helobdella robusta]|uniref:CBM21 domain-containing protein n=1 Tax=Helobdella robusta TaxID=6412 RepID=T1FHL2_HELRO|nr:hypothetical protein HELRODRAFT_182010 [Helobdella robusta]ESN91836.1 hypothetical protein HELRODRAFT_182010 [Helobdella robusta]
MVSCRVLAGVDDDNSAPKKSVKMLSTERVSNGLKELILNKEMYTKKLLLLCSDVEADDDDDGTISYQKHCRGLPQLPLHCNSNNMINNNISNNNNIKNNNNSINKNNSNISNSNNIKNNNNNSINKNNSNISNSNNIKNNNNNSINKNSNISNSNNKGITVFLSSPSTMTTPTTTNTLLLTSLASTTTTPLPNPPPTYPPLAYPPLTPIKSILKKTLKNKNLNCQHPISSCSTDSYLLRPKTSRGTRCEKGLGKKVSFDEKICWLNEQNSTSLYLNSLWENERESIQQTARNYVNPANCQTNTQNLWRPNLTNSDSIKETVATSSEKKDSNLLPNVCGKENSIFSKVSNAVACLNGLNNSEPSNKIASQLYKDDEDDYEKSYLQLETSFWRKQHLQHSQQHLQQQILNHSQTDSNSIQEENIHCTLASNLKQDQVKEKFLYLPDLAQEQQQHFHQKIKHDPQQSQREKKSILEMNENRRYRQALNEKLKIQLDRIAQRKQAEQHRQQQHRQQYQYRQQQQQQQQHHFQQHSFLPNIPHYNQQQKTKPIASKSTRLPRLSRATNETNFIQTSTNTAASRLMQVKNQHSLTTTTTNKANSAITLVSSSTSTTNLFHDEQLQHVLQHKTHQPSQQTSSFQQRQLQLQPFQSYDNHHQPASSSTRHTSSSSSSSFSPLSNSSPSFAITNNQRQQQQRTRQLLQSELQNRHRPPQQHQRHQRSRQITFFADFIQPVIKNSKLIDKIKRQHIALEYCNVIESHSKQTWILFGIILVQNLICDRKVFVRYSTDSWTTYRDLTAVLAEQLTPLIDAYTFGVGVTLGELVGGNKILRNESVGADDDDDDDEKHVGGNDDDDDVSYASEDIKGNVVEDINNHNNNNDNNNDNDASGKYAGNVGIEGETPNASNIAHISFKNNNNNNNDDDGFSHFDSKSSEPGNDEDASDNGSNARIELALCVRSNGASQYVRLSVRKARGKMIRE